MLLDELVNGREKWGLRRSLSIQKLDKLPNRLLFLRREFADEIGEVFRYHLPAGRIGSCETPAGH